MCPTSDAIANVRKGDRLQVEVVRIVPAGAIVKWGDGGVGIVRNQELDWGRGLTRPTPVVAVGEEFSAIVIEADKDAQRVVLSRKRALYDPLQKVRDGRYRTMMVVQGEVVNVTHLGAFVEIEPGIEGLIHWSAIPGGDNSKVEDLLWIGDQVEVVITQINLGQEDVKISLSLLERLRQRAADRAHQLGTTMLSDTMQSHTLPRRENSYLYARYGDLLGKHIRRIVIIDNEPDFVEEFADWLRHWGYDVSAMADGKRPLEEIPASDLAFVDIDLGDVDGLQVAKHIREHKPDTRVVLMSGLHWFLQNGPLSGESVVSGFLAKPFQDSEVLNLLERLECEASEDTVHEQPTATQDTEFLQRVSDRLQAISAPHQSVGAALDEIRMHMDAGTAILFAVDRFTLGVTIRAASNLPEELVTEDALDALPFSVVRDVAVERQEVRTGAAPLDRRFATLLRLLYFESCIGVSLPDVEHDVLYALFVLDSGRDRYTVQHTMLVASMACLLASRIQTEATQSLIQKAQRFIVIGQVTTGLLHELRNKLSIAGRASSNLLLDCDDFSSQSRPLSPTMLVTKMRRRAERIADASDHLTDLLNEHLGLTRQEKAERVDVNEVLLKTVQQVTPFAEEQDVEISFHPTPHLPPTLVVGVHLAQVFLNIALNAIQQMGIQRVRYDAVPVHKRGALRSFLKITTALDSSDTECPLKIRFMDDGPGIHRKHWTWVFELGTTTRAGGTGLGLYVCRNLIKAIGGRITVERSFMFVGTTFLIELPGLS